MTIKAPRENKQDYFNKKKRYSVSLQAVIDADMKFIDIFCGEPGSLHDGRILRRSNLYARSMQNQAANFPNESFLIGDSAYPMKDWLVFPFKRVGPRLTRRQKDFNFLLSSTRMIVENAFGAMKNRFRRLLHFTEQVKIPFIVNLIACGCILHNICVDQDVLDEIGHDYQGGGGINNNPPVVQAIDRRQRLINDLVAKGIL